MTAPTELLPCPFCGGEASPDGTARYSEKHAKEQGWGQTEFYYCNCIHCGVSNIGIIGHKTRSDAVAAWNRRIPASGAGWQEAEPRAWLVEWIQDDEHWIDAHADECRAVDQARRMGGICTPLVPLPAAPNRRAGE